MLGLLVVLTVLVHCSGYWVDYSEDEFRRQLDKGLHDLRCTKKYGKKMMKLEGDDVLTYIPFVCNTEQCKQCLKPYEVFKTSPLITFAECVEYCHKIYTNASTGCESGCAILNEIKSLDGKPLPIDNSTDVALANISLTCRSVHHMMLRMEARYTSSAVPTNNPYGFIVLPRFSMSDSWKIIAVDYDFKEVMQTFREPQIQLAVAMVSTRGVVVKTTDYSSLLDVLIKSEMMHTLYSQRNITQAIEQYSLKYTLNQNPNQDPTASCTITFTPPSPSKPCVYLFVFVGEHGNKEAMIPFYRQYGSPDYYDYYRPVFSYKVNDLKLNERYILKVHSYDSYISRKVDRKKDIAIETPAINDFDISTNGGLFKNSNTSNTDIAGPVLPGPPRNFSLTSIIFLGNETSLATVAWQPPSMTSINAIICGYILECEVARFPQKKSNKQIKRKYGFSKYIQPENMSYSFEVENGVEYGLYLLANTTFGYGRAVYLNVTVPSYPSNKSVGANAKRTVITKTHKEIEQSHIIATGVLLTLILPMALVGRYLYKKRRAREAKAMRIQLRDEFLEEGLILPTGEPDNWEVPFDTIVLGEEIGFGAFGTVCKAKVSALPGYPDQRNVVVAVKTLKAMATIDDRKDFLAEIAMMKQIGKHLNVVSMLGCVTQGGPLCLITEYCRYGDLRSYLRLIRDKTRKHPHFKLGPAYYIQRQKPTPTKNTYGHMTNPAQPNAEMLSEVGLASRNKGFCHSRSLLDNMISAAGQTGGASNRRICFCLDVCTCSASTYLPTSVTGEDYCNEVRNTVDKANIQKTNNSKNPFNPSSSEPLRPQTHKHPLDEDVVNSLRSYDHLPNASRHQIESGGQYGTVIARRNSENVVDILTGPVEPLVKYTNGECLISAGNNVLSYSDEQEDDNDRKELTQNELMSFARQIAVGMEYLSQKKFVHRDLAARNVLVCENNLIKVSDFGLTRDVYSSVEYHKSSNTAKLPLKWMAPESIFENVTSSKSDVWSYGVLLWEIVTLGGTPYPGISGKDLCKMLKDGYRMGKPDMCNQQIYNIMKSCWEHEPQNRPTFTELRNQLESLMETEDEVYIDVNFDNDEYSLLVRYSSSESTA